MEEFLTAKEIQDLLKVDRTTIYRMLKDGRLRGVRVGTQWRFSRQEVEAMLSGPPPAEERLSPLPADILPIHCIQPIQNVFGQIAEVACVTTAPDGQPLTEMSNPCSFCRLILDSESGKHACIASWRKLAQHSREEPHFIRCHASLQYARARIEVNGQMAAMIVAGQFYADPPDRHEENRRVQELAALHGIDPVALVQAARDLPVLEKRRREQLAGWLTSVADTFEQVAQERAALMGRLQQIAAISSS